MEVQLQGNKQSSQAEVEFECTPAYIARVHERFHGRWVCGLCAEPVKYEAFRWQRKITTDEVMKRHMSFYKEFRSSSPPTNPEEDLILAMKQLLRRTLESPIKKPLTCLFIFY
ncbi:hypothetical protein UlMin_034543 [Ulmus minor]